ncbi:MSHA biogenesis protein MshK [endosymbiont of unidentified scaly snail isolate Monju]|nr:MSHA biogenesis protein MshK [endosymbiont of unidentified scaly snail isolate Monju]
MTTLLIALATPALTGAQALFDPTRPPQPAAAMDTTTPARQALPPLQALIARGAHYSALIGGRRFGVGDRIGSWRITAIDRSGVALEGPQGPQRLYLRQTAFKRAAEENTR